MISTWFDNPHKLHRPYNFQDVASVATPFRRGLGDIGVEDLPIFTPAVDFTPDILSSSWAATLGASPLAGGAVARYSGGGIPCGQGINPTPCPSGGISLPMIGLGLLALILLSGGHK